MKKTKFSESKIIGIRKEREQGKKVADICREHGKELLRLFSSLLLALVINCSYSQQMAGTFTVNDCTFIHTRKQLDKMVS